ncbi:DNA translocase FtsK [mine drainage metagenome]|uniref:DNA translocase FtsK n=1 Tax=mine drainage metagenome TaxID=410659 RepID=A0A1J5QXR9_9ZZZZ
MQEYEIKAWRNTNLALDLLGKVLRFTTRHWVVTVPVLTWLISGLLFPEGPGALIFTVLVTYICVQRWREARRVRGARYEEAVGQYGSAENLSRVQRYQQTWPEVARHAGLCHKTESYGLGTFGAYREALRTLAPFARLDAMRTGSPLDGVDVPRLLGVRPSPLGVTLEVEMLPGQGLSTYEKGAELIAHQWDVDQVRVVLARPGVVEITPVTESPLAEVMEITPSTMPVMESLKAVQVGIQEDGRPWMFPLLEMHAVVGGVPGSGKSVFGNVLLAGIASREDIQILGIDCAGGVEFEDWRPRMFGCATNQEEAIEHLEALWNEYKRREEWLKSVGFRSVKNAGLSAEVPLIVCLIDEAAFLFRLDAANKQEKERGQHLVDLVTRLVTLARRAGIVVVLMTQKPTTNTLPSIIRDNAQVKVSFRVTTPEAATAVLGDSASLAPISPTEIGREQRGVAIAEGADGDLTVVRAFYINEESDRAIARRYAHLTRPLPRAGDEDIVEAEIIQEGSTW